MTKDQIALLDEINALATPVLLMDIGLVAWIEERRAMPLDFDGDKKLAEMHRRLLAGTASAAQGMETPAPVHAAA